MTYICSLCHHQQITPDSNDRKCHKCGGPTVTKRPSLLMLPDVAPCSLDPIIDHYTKALTYAWRHCRSHGDHYAAYRGRHFAACGAVSDNLDHYIYDRLTNSLCIHYIAYHRSECLETDFKFLDRWFPKEDQEAEPYKYELLPAFFDKEAGKIQDLTPEDIRSGRCL